MSINIVVLLQTASSFPIYESMYYASKRDAGFNVIIVLTHTKQSGLYDDFRLRDEDVRSLQQKGVEFVLAYNEADNTWLDLRSLKPDFVFLNTPYEREQRPKLYHLNKLNKFTTTAYIPYGITTAAIQGMQFNLPFHRSVHLIFCETELHKDLFLKYCQMNPVVLKDKIFVTGYPKLDFYHNYKPKSRKNKFFKSNGAAVKRLIWSPHWTFHHPSEKSGIIFSDFHKTYLYFLDLVSNNKNIEIMLKPHPFMWVNLESCKIMTQDEIREFKIAWLENDNASIYEGGDYFTAFMESDAILNSSLSFLSEYMPTKKPMLFIEGDKALFNEFGKELIKGLYIAKNTSDITDFLRNLEEGRDENLQLRLSVLNQFYKDEHVYLKIIEVLSKYKLKSSRINIFKGIVETGLIKMKCFIKRRWLR